jgi:Bacteriophage protein of unknown function (DUF646).
MSFSGSVRIGFTVQGLNEAIRGLSAMATEINQTKLQIHREVADIFVKQAKTNVHKITHTLEKSIRVESVTSQNAIVSANTPYARVEESRPGNRRISPHTPHAYMKPAAAATALQFPNIIRKNFDILLNRHKTR